MSEDRQHPRHAILVLCLPAHQRRPVWRKQSCTSQESQQQNRGATLHIDKSIVSLINVILAASKNRTLPAGANHCGLRKIGEGLC